MNVAPEPVDVHSPEKHLKHVCFHEDVRKVYEQTLSWGFVDVFRAHYPKRQQFTFWDYRQPSALANNRGWRIDHILATPILAQACTKVSVDLGPRKAENPSDHTVLWANFSLGDLSPTPQIQTQPQQRLPLSQTKIIQPSSPRRPVINVSGTILPPPTAAPQASHRPPTIVA